MLPVWLGSVVDVIASFLRPLAGAVGKKTADEVTGEAELRRRREEEARERAQTEMGAAQLEEDYERIRKETE